ncbi:hypothetical protein GCM10027614_67190 [Micromonospora vulcania]
MPGGGREVGVQHVPECAGAPQPGQSSPVVSLSKQVGAASGSAWVGSLSSAYPMPAATQPTAASGTAQRGARS